MIALLLPFAVADEPCFYIGISDSDMSQPSGCSLTTPRHVRDFPVQYRISTNIHGYYTVGIQEGYESWNNIGGATRNPALEVDFRYVGTTSSVSFTDTNYTVSRATSQWMQNNGLSGDEIAHTFRAFRNTNHSTPCALKGADVIINNDFFDTLHDVSTLETNPDGPERPDVCFTNNVNWPTCTASMQAVLAHEVGHVLGLGHAVDTMQIMNIAYPFGGDAGLGVVSTMGEDYECLREARENIDLHPFQEFIYRSSNAAEDQWKNFTLRRYEHGLIDLGGGVMVAASIEKWADVDEVRTDDFNVSNVARGSGLSGNNLGQITASYKGVLTGAATITWSLLYASDADCGDAIGLDNGVAAGSGQRVMFRQTLTFAANGEDIEVPTAGSLLQVPDYAPLGQARVCASIVSSSTETNFSDNVVVSEDTLNVTN
ncbi:MAG: matrixin family metalloprotease [Myxococcota bacterium]